MDRFLCQLCNTIVRCGEKHPCFFYSNDEDFFTIQKPAESEETDNKPDTRLKEIYSGNFNDSFVTIYSNLRENNVQWTSSRKGKHPSLFAGSSNNARSFISSSSSSLDSAVSIRKGEVNSRGNNSTSQTFWNSKKLKSPTTLANTGFSLCKKELFEFDPTKNIMETSISNRADNNSFSSNSNVEFNRKQSQESMKDSAVAGVPAIRPCLHTSDGKLKHTCDLCPMQFQYKSSLIGHYRTHTKENPYKFETCGKQFSLKSSLKIHYLTHTGIKPCKCDVCGKGFIHKGNLNAHYRTHTGEKPFKCETCGKRFNRKETLDIHSRTHSDMKLFECDVCGKGYNQKGNLNAHYRTHTGEEPFACETCGKRFTLKKSLDVHSRTHTGERPFVCDICNKTFATKSNLQRHTKDVHTQERPFKCGICGKTFKSNDARNQHRKEH